MRGLHHHREAVYHNGLMAPVELVGFAGREAQRNIGWRGSSPAHFPPALGVAPHRIVAAIESKIAQRLEKANQRQPLPPRLNLVRGQKLIKLLSPGAKLRHRLNAAFVAELRRLGADRSAHRCPRPLQLPANRLDRLLLYKKRPADFCDRIHGQHPKRSPQFSPEALWTQASVGSRLHADHPANGVLIPRRNTLMRQGTSDTPFH